VTEQSGLDNLAKEGIDSDKVHFVGNVMIDTLMANRERAKKSDILSRLGLKEKGYVAITLHRPSNVDDLDKFAEIITAFEEIQKEIKLVFPMHPRTRSNIKGSELEKRIEAMTNFILLEPIGYLDFLCLMSNAAIVMTDSGGIQEETTILGVPCMTLRKNTERPVTIAEGTNRLVDTNAEAILRAFNQIQAAGRNISSRIPKLWDGKSAERIARIIAEA
jgi:UDP-N-acetylglucosamine 2-epimerase (non-hydrolysing)